MKCPFVKFTFTRSSATEGRQDVGGKGQRHGPLDIIDGVTPDALIAKRIRSITDKAEAAKVAADTRQVSPRNSRAREQTRSDSSWRRWRRKGATSSFPLPRIEGYRNFATKVWNASRFAEMNGCVESSDLIPTPSDAPLNRWILGEASKAVRRPALAIEAFRLNDAANAVYQFAEICSATGISSSPRPVLQGGCAEGEQSRDAGDDRLRARRVVYALLHPFMPFVTEELWTIKGEDGPPCGHARAGSMAAGRLCNRQSGGGEIGWIVELVSEDPLGALRGRRAGRVAIDADLVQASSSIARIVEGLGRPDQRLARIVGSNLQETPPAGSLPIVGDALAALPLAGIVDIEAEKSRLDKEISHERQIAKVDAKLANPDFVARAPEEIIAELTSGEKPPFPHRQDGSPRGRASIGFDASASARRHERGNCATAFGQVVFRRIPTRRCRDCAAPR